MCSASAAIARPVAVEPTWATTSTPAERTSFCADRNRPVRVVSTCSGSGAAQISPSSRPTCGQRSLGLCTTVLPVTSAAPTRPAATATGSFHGVRATTTPRGSGRV